MKPIKPIKKYDMIVKSVILASEKTGKGLEAKNAENQHQMNKLIGYLPDGKKVVVAQRQGKGGMDFTKLMGGKIYAVAVDGFSPVLEKDKDGKHIKDKQKTEDGMPYFTGSGFYRMSDKDYPALSMFEAFTLLRQSGDSVMLITEEQLNATTRTKISDTEGLDNWIQLLHTKLATDQNLCSKFDADMNKKRSRSIARAKEEAEDDDTVYSGVEYKELACSPKDGNPFVIVTFKNGEDIQSAMITLEQEQQDDKGFSRIVGISAEEAIEAFKLSDEFQIINDTVDFGGTLEVNVVQGHIMRTSVAFKRKVENLKIKSEKELQYGDPVYLTAAMAGWTKGLINIMYSTHPAFPSKDYDHLNYVVACRQAEVGMMKSGDKAWTPPVATRYDLIDIITN